MKPISLLLVSMLILFTFGCSENEVNPKPEPPIENFDFALLTDTVWRLTGFVDNSGEIKIPGQEGNHRHWLRFNADTTFSGKTSVNPFWGKIALDVDRSAIQFSDLDITELPDTIDSNLYLERLLTVNSYSVKESELKLYYNEQKDYLLFEPRGEITYPIEVPVVDSIIQAGPYCFLDTDPRWGKPALVNSLDDLNEHLNCLPDREPVMPSLDFNKYSVLHIRYTAANGLRLISRKLTQISANEYEFHVAIRNMTTYAPDSKTVSIVFGKLPPNATIKYIQTDR